MIHAIPGFRIPACGHLDPAVSAVLRRALIQGLRKKFRGWCEFALCAYSKVCTFQGTYSTGQKKVKVPNRSGTVPTPYLKRTPTVLRAYRERTVSELGANRDRTMSEPRANHERSTGEQCMSHGRTLQAKHERTEL